MKSSRLLPWLRSWSKSTPILHGILIAQLIMLPCPSSQGVWVDVDSDGDGVFDSGYEDGTLPPEYVPPRQPEPVPDSDGDHLSNADEAAAGSSPYNPDSDGDGITDAEEVTLTGTSPISIDSNSNGVSDYNEFYGNTAVDTDISGPGVTPYDFDGDTLPDPVDPDPLSVQNDPDSDGDYVPDSQDTDPYNPAEWNDANNNGTNDDAEIPSSDTDGDGVANDTDSNPGDPYLYNDWNFDGHNDGNEDWDSDGVSNLQDSHPNSNCLWCDWNGNGVNDDVEAGLVDSDGDGYADRSDSHPFSNTLWDDWNSNGWNDSAEFANFDGDAQPDSSDSDPQNASLWDDWNHNGINDSAEVTNSDGDSQPDSSDSDPQNASLWEDWNHNGINDSSDPPPDYDMDDDGINNDQDSDPQNSTLSCDWNRNGINDYQEPPPLDQDQDSHPDSEDSDPGNAQLWEDWNHNGYNDSIENQFLDDDNDSHPNAFDTNPQDGTLWNDHNANGINDENEITITDTDGDGYNDDRDTHPDDPQRWNDHDNNGVNDEREAPLDRDGAGIPDEQDAFPLDFDNDGLSDAEENVTGTNPAAADTDGDGSPDGIERLTGTNPVNVDTDGDGLTDIEEQQAYHTDPLVATQVVMSEEPEPVQETVPDEAPAVDEPTSPEPEVPTVTEPEIDMEESVGAVIDSNHFIQNGATTSFPSLSGKPDKSDLKKTFTIHNTGTADLTGLAITKDGVDSLQYTFSGLTSTTLAPNATATFTVTFKAPTPITQSRNAALHITSNDADEPSFDITLTSIVASGIWKVNNTYFAADLTDRDNDGIPDLVEEMYAPLVVTAEGDLDGDGVSNLDQYRAGLDLRGNKSADTDDDGLANTTEDAWGKIYHGQLSKYRFADAYADPDGDGLLTIEELSGTWGSSSVKDPAAVITHPFLKSTGPNTSAANSALTYKTSSRAVPTSTSEAKVKWSWRESSPNYSAWMNDGLLRRAYRESYDPITKKYPANFFSARYLYTVPPEAAGEINGSDHLPAGYLVWLSTQGITLPVPAASAPAIGQIPPPNNETRAKLTALSCPGANAPEADADQDSMPNVWEAAYQLDWRNAANASLSLAQSAVAARIAALPLTAAERTEIARLQSTGTGISALIQQSLDKQSAAHLLPDGRSTLLINEYAVTKPAAPPALPASPAATASAAVKTAYEVRRAAWQAAFIALHTWQILTEIDLDHDGLVNADEYSLGLNPQIADYSRTSSRDTDGDGFTDAQELAAGTDAKKATSKPVLALQIISGAGQSGTIFQTLGKPIQVQSIFKGPSGGFCPAPGTTIEITAPNNYTLLAPSAGFGNEPASPEEWRPKTLRLQADTQGYAKIAVKLPNVAGNLSLAVVAIKGVTKSANAPCVLKVVAATGDSDGDGIPSAWETLKKLAPTVAKDATESPLHFDYHPGTPLMLLSEIQRASLSGLRDDTGLYREYGVAPAAGFVTREKWTVLNLIDPDHDGRSNLEEYRDSIKDPKNPKDPKVADYPDTAERDSDGDGFTNQEELKAVPKTNPLLATSHPVFDLAIISGDKQEVPAVQIFPGELVVKASVAGVAKPGIALTFTASLPNMGMADATTYPSVWLYQTALTPLTIKTGAGGLAKVRVRAPGLPAAVEIKCTPVYHPQMIRTFTAKILTYAKGGNVWAEDDTDNDLLPDEWELAHGFLVNPLANPKETSLDADSDTLTNLEEFQLRTDPKSVDTDGDIMTDGWEVEYGLNPLDPSDAGPLADLDQDGLSNLREFQLKTDPNNKDTDGDSIPDGWEADHQLDPGLFGQFDDLDRDGFTNIEEYRQNTDPLGFDPGGPAIGSATTSGPGPIPGSVDGPSLANSTLGEAPPQGRIVAFSRTRSSSAEAKGHGAGYQTTTFDQNTKFYARKVISSSETVNYASQNKTSESSVIPTDSRFTSGTYIQRSSEETRRSLTYSIEKKTSHGEEYINPILLDPPRTAGSPDSESKLQSVLSESVNERLADETSSLATTSTDESDSGGTLWDNQVWPWSYHNTSEMVRESEDSSISSVSGSKTTIYDGPLDWINREPMVPKGSWTRHNGAIKTTIMESKSWFGGAPVDKHDPPSMTFDVREFPGTDYGYPIGSINPPIGVTFVLGNETVSDTSKTTTQQLSPLKGASGRLENRTELSNPVPWSAIDSAMKGHLASQNFPEWTNGKEITSSTANIGTASYQRGYAEAKSAATDISWFLHYEIPNNLSSAERAALQPIDQLVRTTIRDADGEIIETRSITIHLEPGQSSTVHTTSAINEPAIPEGGSISHSLLPIEIDGVWERDQKWNKVPNPKKPPAYMNVTPLPTDLLRNILFVSVESGSGKVELIVKTSGGGGEGTALLCGIRDTSSSSTGSILTGCVPVTSGETQIDFTPTGPVHDKAYVVVLGMDKNSDGQLI